MPEATVAPRPQLHIAAISLKNLDSGSDAGYCRKLVNVCEQPAEPPTEHHATSRGASAISAAVRATVTRSGCEDLHSPVAQLLQTQLGDVPAEADAIAVELVVAQKLADRLHIPAGQLGRLGGRVAALSAVQGICHPTIISNYPYFQCEIVVSIDSFMKD
jgi:hypothetical protein